MKNSKYRALYSVLLLLALWYLLHYTIQAAIIPSPHIVIANFIAIFPTKLLMHLLASLWRIVLAIGISIVLGTAIGVVVGLNDKADGLVSPLVYLVYPIPKIAFLPVFMILFGLGDTSKVVLIVSIIIFQIIVTTRDGVKELSKELFYSARSLGMSAIDTYRHLIIPAVLPKILSALRVSVGISIAVLFFGENFATRYGIGYFIMNSWTMVNYTEMFSGIMALSIMGLLLFKLIDIIEGKLCLWVRLSNKA